MWMGDMIVNYSSQVERYTSALLMVICLLQDLAEGFNSLKIHCAYYFTTFLLKTKMPFC